MKAENRSRALSVMYYIGVVLMVLSICELIPLVTSVVCGETRFIYVFLASASIMMSIAAIFMSSGAPYRNMRLSFGEGMTVASGSWLLGIICHTPTAALMS